MKFYHQGKKKSNQPGIASGCLILIGFSAIIFMFSLIDSVDDFKEYSFQIILAVLVGAGLLFSLFRKKATLHNFHISIADKRFKIGKISVLLDEITMDCYEKEGSFSRYHLRDKKGKIAIYSVIPDDLYTYFTDKLESQTHVFEENSYKYNGPDISVFTNQQSLHYDLETGRYEINKGKQSAISFLPEIYSYDGNYKLGKPLFKKK